MIKTKYFFFLFLYFYVPRLKAGTHPVLGQAPKSYASRFFQLKLGHGAIGVS